MAAGAVVGGVLAGAGLIMQIEGQNQAQNAQRDQLEAQARGARESARLARLEAAENAKIQQVQSEKIISGLRPQFAASGVDEEGTVFDVIANSVQNAERDRLNIIYAGEMRARAFESGAYAYGLAAGGINNMGQVGTGLSGIGQIIGRLD
jgi:hypothetical protein